MQNKGQKKSGGAGKTPGASTSKGAMNKKAPKPVKLTRAQLKAIEDARIAKTKNRDWMV